LGESGAAAELRAAVERALTDAVPTRVRGDSGRRRRRGRRVPQAAEVIQKLVVLLGRLSTEWWSSFAEAVR
jgi:hypothetical protein